MDHHQETARQHPLDSMKRLLFLLAFLCASIPALGQSNPPLRITEVDGSPTKTNATRLNFPNGTLTISGSTVTVSASGSFSAPVVITSNSAACFEVGPNGSTNPVFRVVCNVASQATGLSVTGNAAGSGTVVNTLSSGSNEALYVLSKGTGPVAISNATFTATSGAAFHVEKAAIAGREIMGKFTVSDGGNSAFFINNVTNNASLYVPTMSGYLDSVNTAASFAIQGFVSSGNDASDSATGGILALQVQRTDSTSDPINGTLTAVVNRKVFSIANFTAQLMMVGANGNIGLNTNTFGTSAAKVVAVGSGTAPSTSPADVFQLYGADSAAGDANAFIRNEAGEINRLTGLAARNSAQFDKTSSTTFSTVTGLTRNVEASRVYAFRAVLKTTANVAGGVKFQVGGTATATAISYEGVLIDTGAIVAQTRSTALATTVCALTTSTAGTCTIEGVVQINAGGTLTIDFAQNASNGAASSVLANQSFQLIPIG